MLAAGALDPSFGVGGKVIDDLGIGVDEQIHASALQSDGKIVVAGFAFDGSKRDFLIARYNADGTRDASFGTSGAGYTRFNASAGAFDDGASDLAIDDQGRIVVVGSAASAAGRVGVCVVRLDADGLFDATFDGDGVAFTLLATTTPFIGRDVIGSESSPRNAAVALDGAGQIVVGTSIRDQFNSEWDFLVLRYTSAGALDASFDGDGYATTDFTGGSDDLVADLAIQGDGRIVVVGSTKPVSGIQDIAVARYNANGSLDATFDGDGRAITSVVNDNEVSFTSFSQDFATSVFVEADGQIVVGGFANVTPGNAKNLIIARYNSNGALDATFGPASTVPGTRRYNVAGADDWEQSWAMAVQPAPDGKYVLGAHVNFTSAALDDQFVLVRVLPGDGSLDPTFDGDGVAQATFAGQGSLMTDVRMQADGKILAVGYVGGTTARDVGMMRFESGLLVADAGGPYALDEPGGSVVLAGAAVGSGALTFEWDLDGDEVFGEAGAGALAGDENVQNPTFVAAGVDGPGALVVTLRVSSDANGDLIPDEVAVDTATVVINNVAPTLTIAGAATVDEGSTYALSLAASDPGADAITSWTINWGDGTETVAGNPTSVTHIYADGDASYTITATAADEDGTHLAGNSVTVAALNVAPTANAGGPYLTFDDASIQLQGTGTDAAGGADPLSFAWDLDGDGAFGEAGAGAARGNEVGATPTFNPAGLAAGAYAVSLRVSDGDGGNTVASTTVQVLAEGVLLIDHTLYVIGGNSRNDIALISQCDDEIIVLATFQDSNPARFDAADVQDIQVRTRGGNDIVITTSNVTATMTIDGGSGNDLLTGGGGSNLLLGGSGNDALYGSAGNDVLLGGAGNDDLAGGTGDDVLVGGAGHDNLCGGAGRDLIIGGEDHDDLEGGAGEDIIIGGYTIHDGNVAALDAIMDVWTSADPIPARIAALSATGGLLEAGVAVFDDDDRDELDGGTGRDWYFGDVSRVGDRVTDSISLQSTLDVLTALN